MAGFKIRVSPPRSLSSGIIDMYHQAQKMSMNFQTSKRFISTHIKKIDRGCRSKSLEWWSLGRQEQGLGRLKQEGDYMSLPLHEAWLDSADCVVPVRFGYRPQSLQVII